MSRRLSSVGALLLCSVLLLAGCVSLPQQPTRTIAPPAGLVGYCSTTYPEQCGLSPLSSYGSSPRFYKVQLGGGGISGYPLSITSPSNDECLLLQGPPWVIANGSCSGSSSTAWPNVTGGTNTSAAMVVGTGASLTYTGSGSINASEIAGLAWPSLVSSDCLTNNGTTLSWGTCGSGGSTTFQVNGTGLASSSTVNFENSVATDGLTLTFANPSAGIVQLGFTGTLSNSGLANSATTVNTETCTLGSTCTIPFDINSSALTSQAGLNFITSTTNSVGLTVTPSNPSTNEAKFEITGSSYTGNAATATNLASYPTLCSGSQFSQGLSSGSNNCATPSGSGITLQTNGTNNSSQTALNIESGSGTVAANPSGGNVTISVYAAQITYSASTESLTCSTINAALLTNTASGTATWTLPTTGTTGCGVGFSFDIQNTSSSTLTVNSSSDINGAGSLSIPTGDGCSITTDNGGATYDVSACTALVSGGGSGTVNNCSSSDYVAYYASSGTAVSCEQYIVAAQFPAITGDVSGADGSLSTTVVKVNGASLPTSAACAATNSSGQIIACTTVTYLLDEGTKFSVSSGTGACSSTSTLVGGTSVGSAECTGTTGSSTLVLTLPSAPNGIWICKAIDKTTSANTITETTYTATSATLSGTVTADDVIAFACMGS